MQTNLTGSFMSSPTSDDEIAYAEKNGHPPAYVIFDCADSLGIPRTKAADGTETFHNWARAVWNADYHHQTDATTVNRDAQIAIAKSFLGE